MAKSVLGNNPFLRGAALRPLPPEPEPQLEAVAPPTAREAPERPPSAPPPSGLPERLRGAMARGSTALSSTLGRSPLSSATRTAQGLVRGLRAALGTYGSAAEPDLYGRDEQLVEQLSGLRDFLYRRYWRVSVKGAELVPQGPALLVANHAGAVPLDGPVLAETLRRERPDLAEPRWLVEDQIFYAPFLGALFNRLGAVRACPENAVRLLSEQRPVLVFPEGIQGISKPFRDRYQLKRFGRGGFVKIALRTGAPIVPVAILGAEETLPLMAKLPIAALGLPYLPVTPLGPVPLPAKWTVRFGAPLDVRNKGPDAAEDISAVQELTEATRGCIETMLRDLQAERRGIFTG